MSGPTPGGLSVWEVVERARRRGLEALEAASRVAAAAARQEQLAASGSLAAEVHARTARAHRGSEACLRATARMELLFADRTAKWAVRRELSEVPRPVLMDAVASTVGWRGAVLSLGNSSGVEYVVAASDATARRAHELEMALAEGPSWRASAGSAAAASGVELARLWPRYGSAVSRLGVDAVAAVPVRLGRLRGSLTVTGPAPPRMDTGICALGDVADALSRSVLAAPDAVGERVAGLPGVVQLEKEDYQPALQQAAGALAWRNGWTVEDAVALVRARAYVEERPVAEVATDVLAGKLVFTDDD